MGICVSSPVQSARGDRPPVEQTTLRSSSRLLTKATHVSELAVEPQIQRQIINIALFAVGKVYLLFRCIMSQQTLYFHHVCVFFFLLLT